MSNINELIIGIQSILETYNQQAGIQDKKKDICYEGKTLSYANWILGLHKDVSPNTTKTVYLYTNVCKKIDDGNDVMYEEYLLLRPDKEIDDDGEKKTLRKHMNEKYKEDINELTKNNDWLKQANTKLSEQREKLREKEEQRDDIMNSLQNIQGDDDNAGSTDISITATTLPDTNDDKEGMVQDKNDDDQRIELIELEQLNEELEQLNKAIQAHQENFEKNRINYTKLKLKILKTTRYKRLMSLMRITLISACCYIKM